MPTIGNVGRQKVTIIIQKRGQRVKLLAHPVRTGQARLGLPGDVDMIIGSALTPLRESVTALPAPAYRQEGGASSRLARD